MHINIYIHVFNPKFKCPGRVVMCLVYSSVQCCRQSVKGRRYAYCDFCTFDLPHKIIIQSAYSGVLSF